MQCLIKLETPEKSDAKMELIALVSDLMPQGKPKYLEVIKYPMIRQLIETEGKKKMLAVLVLMIKDFCSSLNVVRNMNEDQMIEAAAMLLDECENFRLEDYMIMFSMAKRGELVKIMDRIDLQVITAMLDEYFTRRKLAAINKVDNEINRLDSIGNTTRQIENLHPDEAKLAAAGNGISAAIEALRVGLTDAVKNEKE
ncbi:MAG: hypothetical protein IPJ81_16225 [Chitinophagaceae bacterium]|nr:hypothetical protein [Chitinophagaceae bacterium]